MIEILQFMLIAVLAGFLGSLVGLGGGIIITPALTIPIWILILNMLLEQVLSRLLQQVVVQQ